MTEDARAPGSVRLRFEVSDSGVALALVHVEQPGSKMKFHPLT